MAKYQNGCSIMENLIPLPQGGAQKRPGTKYIAEVKTSSLATRLLPFEFSTSQAYVIEVGNQYMRFFKDGAAITGGMGTEDLSSIGNIVAHWKLNDAAATTAVVDADGATHDGIASANTDTLSRTGKINNCLTFKGDSFVTVADDDALTFIEDGGTPKPFSIAAWIFVKSDEPEQEIITKWKSAVGEREWQFEIAATGQLGLALHDPVNVVTVIRRSSTLVDISEGWHHVVATYPGTGGSNAPDDIILYIDGSSVAVGSTGGGGAYSKMANETTDVLIGAQLDSGGSETNFFKDRIDNVAIFSIELSSAQVTTLYNSTVYEIVTPYLTADLFDIKFEQSADVLYLAHPSYEGRKLARTADTEWIISVAGINTGPFKTQNTDVTKTITASATSGTAITLTATGHLPFKVGTTAGHSPGGEYDTSISQTGALFKLVHPIDTLSFKSTLEDDIGASQVENTSWMSCGTLYKGAGWTFVTSGTWLGTVKVQRNYTIGAAVGNGGDEGASLGWETVFSFDGVSTARNVSTSGSEDDGDADYRVIFADDTSGTVLTYFTTDQTEVVGVVEITAVANATSATGNVIRTLGDTTATYKWSEGSWSNYRGWPQTVTFFEDRLTFGGNTSQPDTIWASVTSDYQNMTAGPDDDEALIFTLSSRRVNVIEWIIGKDKLLIGTSGAEWTIAGGTDEPLTPSNAIAKQHSTYGSANLQAGIANESILFFQRGAKKMRELAYNWEIDSYVAPDMTILANLVTNGGIVDTAFQKTPDSILWCVRGDGELPVFSYERKENITAWSRMISHTNLAGTLTDSDFESVARISGSTEDEIWVVVNRTIGAATVRYIEQFQSRDFGTDADDAFYVDAGVTYDSTASSAMTGLDHLEGQTIYVLADGVVFDTEIVGVAGGFSAGEITLSLDNVTTTASTVQMGLGYEVHLRTMPLSWLAGDTTIQGRQKKIGEVIANWYVSGDFSVGKDASTLRAMGLSGQTTAQDRVTFPAGWDRNGYVYVYQKSPEPLTILALIIEFSLK